MNNYFPNVIEEKLIIYHIEDDPDWRNKINLVLEEEFSYFEFEFIQITTLPELEPIVTNGALPSILIVDLNLNEEYPDHEGFAYLVRHAQSLLKRHFEIFVFSGFIQTYSEIQLIDLGIPTKHVIDKNSWVLEDFIILIRDALVRIKKKIDWIADAVKHEQDLPILELNAKFVGDAERLEENIVYVTENNEVPYSLSVFVSKLQIKNPQISKIEPKELFLFISGAGVTSKPKVAPVNLSSQSLPEVVDFEVYFKIANLARESYLTISLYYKNALVKSMDFKVKIIR